MHPLLANRAMLGLYIALWVAVGAAMALQAGWMLGLPLSATLLWLMPLALGFGFVCLTPWYLVRRHPVNATPAFTIARAAAGGALQASGFLAGPGTGWGALLRTYAGVPLDTPTLLVAAAVMFAVGIPFYLVSLVAHYLYAALQHTRDVERRVLESQVTAREAELRALRAQLNPHFLFNSLNSINALVGSDPERARRMCEGLGDFLRRTLALGQKDEVSLAEEIELVDRYLAIEKVRFGERLGVDLAVTEEARRCTVPPLLLQPLVENAIKHGVSNRLEGGTVRLVGMREGAWLTLAVENPVDDDAPLRAGEGHGLDNVRRRLAALGERGARMEARREPGRFRVTLTLPAALGHARPA